jgi:glutamate-1-semialdehyde 2,1-aminomutase
VPIQLVTTLTPTDTALMHRAVDGFVPARVFDAHAHLFHTRHFAEGKRPAFLPADTAFGFAAYHAAVARWLPGREVQGLFFPYPSKGNDRAGENRFLAAELAAHPQFTHTRGLALAAPEDDPAAMCDWVRAHGFVGLKPYRLYAAPEDTTQVFIENFAPEWMWALCDAMDGVLMLHLVRSQGIADAANLRDLRRLCTRYPRCRLVLAHVARSFAYRTAFAGLKQVARLDNVVVDTSAITEPEAIRCALETLGPRRVLWGSDFMVSEFRAKAITMGDGFSWIYADELPAPAVTQFENFTLAGIEGLLALREACEATGMNAGDVRDIFHDNGLRLLAPHLPSSGQPRSVTGPELWSEAKTKISGGTGLLSKRAHLFDPQTWPSYFSRCQGAEVWDLDGRHYTDFTGGVGAILLGHADAHVNAALHRRVSMGSYCTLASPDEVELAERLLALHPWAARVRYARGGGEALALAVRIARAATGRSGVAFCGYHGWSDWYLAANLGNEAALDGHLLPGLPPLGVPRELAGTTVPFRYNDPTSFDAALRALDGRLAAVVMEPMRSAWPREDFVSRVAARCRATGGVFVLDEVTSGWRFGFPGAAPRLGIEPDLAVYAKAMSNGVPCAAIVGREAVMDSADGSFISSSYWTDGLGPAAALACLGKMEREGVQAHVWQLGEHMQTGLREVATRHPSLRLAIGGMPCASSVAFQMGDDSAAAKALTIREMLRRGFLFSSQLYVMWPHTGAHTRDLLSALDESLAAVAAIHDRGALRAESGVAAAPTGFARLV